MKDFISPADKYIVVNQTILTEYDKKVLINLYEPIIGAEAVSLYLTLWSDLDKSELVSIELNHHHLLTILKSNQDNILKSRCALEAIGLLRSYKKHEEDLNSYIYELYSPLAPSDFFNHPILGALLLNNIGSYEYNNLIEYYKKYSIKKTDYEEVTATMNETFASVDIVEYNSDIRSKTKLGVNVLNNIDFDIIIKSLPKGLINEKTFNKRNKELINQLSFVYDIDTIKMADIISISIDNMGLINKDCLIKNVRKNYEFNHDGRLPSIVYKTQPEYLSSPKGDTSNRAKMIYAFESTKPYDFLRFKNKGAKPSQRDLEMMESLAINYNLPPGVINVLIDYSIRVNDGKLNKKYLDAIASTFARKGIKTVSDAMNSLTKNHTKINKEKTIKENVIPSWMNKENKSEEVSESELKELEEMFKEYR